MEEVIIIIIVILAVGGLIYYNMPKRYCHMETTTEIIELDGAYGLDDYEYRGISKGDEYICQEGILVKNFESRGTIWFIGTEGICLLKHNVEVCVIK